jgi:hypothetical protein
MMMSMEQSVQWLAVEIEIFGENLPQCRYVHHKSHMSSPELEPGRRGWKQASITVEMYLLNRCLVTGVYVTV